MALRSPRPDPSLLKSPTGISGLDVVTMGGLPRGQVTLIEGGPGAGKTVLALQSVVHAARNLGEPGIFVAFEESATRIVVNASRFGWDIPALQKKKLFFLNAQPGLDVVQSGGFDLGGLLAALDVKIKTIGARRVVFDAIDVVLTLLDEPAGERRELYRLRDWIAARGVTAIVTSKESTDPALQKRREFLQFMTDCAIRLEHTAVQGVSQRSLRVTKYRGSDFHANAAPYVIGASGLDVAGVTEGLYTKHTATDERVSTGVRPLDEMLGGGFFRGAAILATGAPGTAKTTLGGAFAEAACERDEPTLFVSFDSNPDEVIRNLSSVAVRLRRFLDTPKRPGPLKVVYQTALEGSAETHLLHILSLARAQRTRCLIIDPLSALATFTDATRAQSVAKRLLVWAKEQGITLFCSSLLGDGAIESESSPLHVSTIADTWLHLSYVARNGERNRCLSIIKSRGTAHSNQVRELLLSERGITLADSYTAGGEVLLGTLRWEREQAEAAAQQEAARVEHLAHLKLLTEEAELSSRLIALRRKVDAKRAELELLKSHEVARREAASGDRSGRHSRRASDDRSRKGTRSVTK